jgi:hypothetical protein
MKEKLPTLSTEERASLLECLQAMKEGISVEEFRAIKAAIKEPTNDPSPSCSLEDLEADLEKFGLSNAAAV